jgi:hypothetical protein
MHVAALADVAEALGGLDPRPLGTAADFLIFRNDWKMSEQVQRLLSIPGIEERFVASLTRGSGEVVVQLDGIAPEPLSADRVPGAILDSAIYANRVYMATTQGLFETRFDPDRPTSVNPLISRLDSRFSAVTAGYSAVNGSAGEDGLWFGRMNFDITPWWNEQGNFRRVADFSRGNSFADVNLLNYTDDAFPGFLRSETVKERPRGNSEYEDRRITGYGEPADIGGLMTSALSSNRKAMYSTPELGLGIDGDSAEVLGNSGKRLLVAWGESLRVVDLSVRRDRDLEARPDKSFRDLTSLEIDPYNILDTHPFGKGFLIELSNEVRMINSQGSFTLISEPIARIRTFARSRRYREVVLLVREKCVSLLGFYITPDVDSASSLLNRHALAWLSRKGSCLLGTRPRSD